MQLSLSRYKIFGRLLLSTWAAALACIDPQTAIAQTQKICVQVDQAVALNDSSSAHAWMQSQLKVGTHFICTHVRQTEVATYYTFQQVLHGIPIEGMQIKVTVHSDHIRMVQGAYYTGQLPEIQQLPTSTLSSAALVYRLESEKPVLYLKRIVPEDGAHWYYQRADGPYTFMEDRRTYFQLPDTLIRGMVFLPDPLTSTETTYGGDYIDADDADLDQLNDERFEVLIPATFSDDTFFLRTANIVLKDLNAPTIPIANAMSDTFFFTRAEDGFEDVNTLYHLTNLAQYITDIGFPDLANFYLEVDPHGASGADQSFYVSDDIPSIQYGIGGVDDAEDADVIAHEYLHALSDHASPESNTGLERKAIDEGYGDYLAASYSRSYSDYEWQNIFSWDGHNDFWSGRNADTDKHYPEDNSDNYYAASEIWSGALMDIYDLLGKEVCDRIVCESLYGSVANMEMRQAGLILMDAEEMLYGGMYHADIFNALLARGLIYPDPIAHLNNTAGIYCTNSQLFATGNGSLYVHLPENMHADWQLIDISGRVIQQGNTVADIITIDPPAQYSGIICLHVQTTSGQFSQTLVVY